jgi:hypothetical protein
MQVWRHARATGQLRRRRGVPILSKGEKHDKACDSGGASHGGMAQGHNGEAS